MTVCSQDYNTIRIASYYIELLYLVLQVTLSDFGVLQVKPLNNVSQRVVDQETHQT